MTKFRIGALAVAIVLASAAYGQTAASADEEKSLQAALAGIRGNPVELIRAIEKHLEQFPNSSQKQELEGQLVKAAMEAGDSRRVLQYGERVLERNADDPQLLERVTRLLLSSDDPASAEKALKYSLRFQQILSSLEKEGLKSTRKRGEMLEELDRAVGRALVFQARANGNLGKFEEASKLAESSYQRYATAESAREVARWLIRSNKDLEAVDWYARAFTISDPKNTDADRAKDRTRMGELYAKAKGSEAGLGDLILRAYDQGAAVEAKRTATLKQRDPNAGVLDPAEYTLSALAGPAIKLSSLRGKVIILDFWATWCGPCRMQHPLYEEVKKRFTGSDQVVFLNVNADEDPSVVPAFVETQKWDASNVYFEDGLGTLLRVSSIPTTLIIDREGKVHSRMNGFNPQTFVDLLTERIKEALGKD